MQILGLSFPQNVDWVKLWRVAAALFTFWGLLAGLTIVWPAFDMSYKIINTFLGAVSGTFLFAARSGKYVADRTQLPPENGKP